MESEDYSDSSSGQSDMDSQADSYSDYSHGSFSGSSDASDASDSSDDSQSSDSSESSESSNISNSSESPDSSESSESSNSSRSSQSALSDYNGPTRDFQPGRNATGYPKCAHRDRRYPPKRSFIKKDTTFGGCETRRKPSKKHPTKPVEFDFREKMWSLRQEGFGGECTIIVGDREFKIDKLLLMAQSKVFEDMFKSDMQESTTNRVEIKDARPEVIDAFLKYLYVLEFSGSNVLAEGLYCVANKYRVDGLKKDCAAILERTLNKLNIVRRLELAFKHNDADLKKITVGYLTSGESGLTPKTLINSEAWNNLAKSNEKLADEILDAILPRFV